jgi:group I intron endonuclease
MVGIYKMVNIETGLVYIGQSEDIDYRKGEHFRRLKYNRHENPHLQNSYNKHGYDGFVFEVVEECSIEELNEKEKYYIQLYKSFNPKFGYNKTLGGEGGSPNNETRIKISKSLKGHTISPETRTKIANGNRGKKTPKEVIDKISAKTRKLTPTQEAEVLNLLIESNLTQQEIADMYNISTTIINRIKKDNSLPIQRYTILSDKQMEEIKLLIKGRKYHLSEIAKMYNVQYVQISKIKKEMGYNLSKGQLEDSEKLAIIKLLNSKEYTIAQVAEMYGVSRDTIKRVKRGSVSEN